MAYLDDATSLHGQAENSEKVKLQTDEVTFQPGYTFVPGEGYVRNTKHVDIVVRGSDDEDDVIDVTAMDPEQVKPLTAEVRGRGGFDHILFGAGGWKIDGGDGNDLIVQDPFEYPGSDYDGTEISGGNGKDTVVIRASVKDVTLVHEDSAILVNGIKILPDVETIWFNDGRFTFRELLEEGHSQKMQKLEDLDLLKFFANL